ncbi:MAG: GntR family transcriptional regulator [Propylenella sp.]
MVSAETGSATSPVDGIDLVGALEEDILFGRLAPGTRLTEDALLARFPVTRHFVRQALVELEKLGIVVRKRNKGATVRSFTPSEVLDVYRVRELLQRQAALWIPLPASQSLIDELSRIFEAYSKHIDDGYLRGVHETNDQFHLMLFAACGNKYIVDLIELYMRLTLPIRANSMANPQMLAISREHHRLMIEMLAGADNWVLAQLCVDHLQPSKNSYLERVRSSPGLDEGG